MTPLRSYQRDGVGFLVGSGEPRLLAADTRLGKSRVVLEALSRVEAAQVLILCPATGRTSWPIEVERWAPEWLPHLTVIRPGMTPGYLAGARPRRLVIVAYDTLSMRKSPWRQTLAGMDWDALVLDECQYLKSAGANRTQAVYHPTTGLYRRAKRVWLLSGTPAPNHVGELYPHYRALWPHALGAPLSQYQFEDRFCRVSRIRVNHHEVRKIDGSRVDMLPVLRRALSPFVLRQKKADVIRDLPRVMHVPVRIEAVIPAGSNATLARLQHLDDEQLYRFFAENQTLAPQLRRLLGLAKITGAVEWIEEQLAEGIKKLVVFAWHREVIEQIVERLGGVHSSRVAMVYGGTTPSDRDAAVKRFQNASSCAVFVGQIKAAGTAICLDAADEVALVEASTTPADNYQAYSRVENVHLRKSTTVSWLMVANSLDERLQTILRRKTFETGMIM